MPHSVIDVGSNLEENLKRWAKALKGGGVKLAVFEVIYSGKRMQWTAKDISNALKGTASPKRVTEVGNRLDGDSLIRQLPDVWPVVYEKIPNVHHYKSQILALVKHKSKFDALPTKRKFQVKVLVGKVPQKGGRAIEVTVDDIDQFAKVRNLKDNLKPLKPLPEAKFKSGLQKLFRDTGRYPDWGGEKDDFFTNKLKMNGKRYSVAFALKGPGVGIKTMTPGKWGKHGNQIQRLVGAPARVFLLQFEGQIDEYSVEQLKKLTAHKANEEKQNLFYGYIDKDDSLRLRRAYPNCF